MTPQPHRISTLAEADAIYAHIKTTTGVGP